MNLPHTKGVHIEAIGLEYRYTKGSKAIFSGLNLSVPRGQALAIVGRSGCGKSTLLHILAGLNPATAGIVTINHQEVTDPHPNWVMMFQAPHLYPWMTVKENAGVGLGFAGWSMEKKDARVREVIELVGLTEHLDKNVQDLSGGQQQRVALARSLVMEPELLLLDEPFSALDAFTRRQLQTDVRRLSKELGFNLIIVTHDIDEAILMADRAVIMACQPDAPAKIADDVTITLSEADRTHDSALHTAASDDLMARFKAVSGNQTEEEAVSA